IRAERDGITLRGTIKGNKATGKLTGKDKGVRDFTAASVKSDVQVGLVRAEGKGKGEEYVGGGIVFREGGDVKAVGNAESRAPRSKGRLKNFLQKVIGGLAKLAPTLKGIAPALDAVVPGLGTVVLRGVSVAERFAQFITPLAERAPVAAAPAKGS